MLPAWRDVSGGSRGHVLAARERIVDECEEFHEDNSCRFALVSYAGGDESKTTMRCLQAGLAVKMFREAASISHAVCAKFEL